MKRHILHPNQLTRLLPAGRAGHPRGIITILAIADLHSGLTERVAEAVKRKAPIADAIVTLGDINVDSLSQIKAIVSQCSRAPFFGVLGNHDDTQTMVYARVHELNGSVIALDDSCRHYTFTGISGSIRYKDSNSYAMITKEQAVEQLRKLPPANILIAHDFPHGAPFEAFTAHEGMPGLAEYLRKKTPCVLLHGHIHKNILYQLGKTSCVSVFGAALITVKDGTLQNVELL